MGLQVGTASAMRGAGGPHGIQGGIPVREGGASTMKATMMHGAGSGSSGDANADASVGGDASAGANSAMGRDAAFREGVECHDGGDEQGDIASGSMQSLCAASAGTRTREQREMAVAGPRASWTGTAVVAATGRGVAAHHLLGDNPFGPSRGERTVEQKRRLPAAGCPARTPRGRWMARGLICKRRRSPPLTTSPTHGPCPGAKRCRGHRTRPRVPCCAEPCEAGPRPRCLASAALLMARPSHNHCTPGTRGSDRAIRVHAAKDKRVPSQDHLLGLQSPASIADEAVE